MPTSTPELNAKIVQLLTDLVAGISATEAGGRALPVPVDQIAWERDTLAHWLGLRPDLDSVTIIVRSYGKPVATLCLEPDAAPVVRACGASADLRPQA